MLAHVSLDEPVARLGGTGPDAEHTRARLLVAPGPGVNYLPATALPGRGGVGRYGEVQVKDRELGALPFATNPKLVEPLPAIDPL